MLMNISKTEILSAIKRRKTAWVVRYIITNQAMGLITLVAVAIAIIHNLPTLRGNSEATSFMSNLALPVGGALLIYIGIAHIAWFLEGSPAGAWLGAWFGFVIAVLCYTYFTTITPLLGLIASLSAGATLAGAILFDLLFAENP